MITTVIIDRIILLYTTFKRAISLLLIGFDSRSITSDKQKEKISRKRNT